MIDLAVSPAATSPVSLRELCERFFAPDGILRSTAAQSGKACEYRPQQLEMARALVEILEKGRHLCVEAPTGVGKSFAYLVPLIYRAKQEGRPAVVSTETINLQEQLIQKDIPFLAKLCGVEFKAALAKGRHNYLCRRRFALLSGEQRDSLLPSATLLADLKLLDRWCRDTKDGDRDGADFRPDPAVWSMVCSETSGCLGPKCGFFRTCFYQRARLEWANADIIVANHALFFTDMAMKAASGTAAGGLLPNYGVVLIDEAHTLEANAAEYLGIHISHAGVNGALNRLYNPESARGLLMREGKTAMKLRAAAAEVRRASNDFFARYEAFLAERSENSARILDPGLVRDNLSGVLLEFYKQAAAYAEDEVEDDSLRTEFALQLSRCLEYASSLSEFAMQSRPDSAYYVENERDNISVNIAPLNVAEILSEQLFGQDFPVALCSATLTVGNRFDYYAGRIGFHDGEALRLDSPFSAEQAKLYIPRTMPDPGLQEDFEEAVCDELPRFLDMSKGRAFVLFTSHKMLRHVSEAMRPHCLKNGWRLLIQGEDLSRTAMLREFKAGNAVLFGTDSFWTGVDVPGDALSNVVITKLPFLSPGNPLVAAREERIRLSGKNPFMEYSLPEAVLKFKQGVGRLIRSRSDTGILVLLDRRVFTKRYGRMFLDSIPYKVEQV
ncbi:MAG: helicase C-terminal domain-containing protein [Victivallaceae bacterium]|nr:helicase C-terminal domain-containing protein [Victivallaceae bacterium]